MTHEEIKNLLALAALDRLDPEEAHALEEHLRAGCDECHAELREFRETAASLALSLDPAGAEDRIRDRLEARLASGSPGASTRPATAMRPPTALRARRGRVRIWQATAGALAATLAMVAIYAAQITTQLHLGDAQRQRLADALGSQIRSLRLELASSHGQVATLERVLGDRLKLERVLTAPDLRMVRLEPLAPAPGARAIVVTSRATDAAMIQASGLPQNPPGKIYELWWITQERGPLAAGLFGGGAPVLAPATLPPAGEHVMVSAVTLEPAGGVTKPTGAMYLKGVVPDPE
jgi:hypothetical protein